MAAKKSQESEKPIRPRHKKSLSDGFDKAMGDQQMKFYNMFMNNKPPDDFMKIIGTVPRKDTADSGIARNVNLDFIEESWQSPPKMNEGYAIKNYPVPSSGLSSQ